MRESLNRLVARIVRSRLAMIGAWLSLLILPILLLLTLLDLAGVAANPYFAFINYLVLGPLFCLGLLLFIIGLIRGGGDEEIGLFALEYLKEQMTLPGRLRRVRHLLYLKVGLVFMVIMVMGVVTYSGARYTDSVAFCGQFCHSVMEPQYTAYRQSSHSRVSCVRCHLGTETQRSLGVKLSGVRQIAATVMNTYPRPITSPITHLRPSRQTCEECHRPEIFHGDRLVIREHFLADEENTAVRTMLLLKVGAGGYQGREAHGIHWHISPLDTVSYRAADPRLEKIVEVRWRRADGSEKIFRDSSDSGSREPDKGGELRVMDCIDCHNRPSHIFLGRDDALDRQLLTGAIPASLPHIKEVGLTALAADYDSAAAARLGITGKVRSWYQRNRPDLARDREVEISLAAHGIFQAWQENVFPEMGVDWDTYRDFIGHRHNSGCFRCHNDRLRTAAGETIDNACNTCHLILAREEQEPDVLKILRGINRGTDIDQTGGSTPLPYKINP